MIFCLNCLKEVEYNIDLETRKIQVRDEQIEIEQKNATCKVCGQPVFVKEIEDENLRKAFDAYKVNKGLLTSTEIKSIREKYNITQVQFAKILGLGEKTIARYENGSIQDEAINNLILLSADIKNIVALWEKNRYKFSLEDAEEISIKIEKPHCKTINFMAELGKIAEKKAYKKAYTVNDSKYMELSEPKSFLLPKGGQCYA